MVKRRVIIDTDPGIDDAVALAIALFSEEIKIELLTTVVGNVSCEQVTINLLRLLRFYNKKIPVAKGAVSPLLREVIDASDIHGESGLEGYEFPDYDSSLLLSDHAVEAIANVLRNEKDKITLVGIGPLTNYALLIKMYPNLLDKIDELVLMGGSSGRGNKGVYSEFNIASDPEAAKIVFESGIPITLVGLEVGDKAIIYPEDSKKIRKLNPVGEMMYHLFMNYRSGSFESGLNMYDVCAIAYLLDPTLMTTVTTHVAIETAGQFTSGATVVDFDNYLNQEVNCRYCIDVGCG